MTLSFSVGNLGYCTDEAFPRGGQMQLKDALFIPEREFLQQADNLAPSDRGLFGLCKQEHGSTT